MYAEDQATVVADQANLDRLNALEAFKVLRAPFDGIVTARNVDVGTYVANGSGNQLFVVDQISPLRIYMQVPQAYAQLVKIGMEADLTLPEFPGRTFQAHVTNTADVVDPTSRSLLTELLGELHDKATSDLRDYGHLHQVRIAGKRLRYALEVFADCFGPNLRPPSLGLFDRRVSLSAGPPDGAQKNRYHDHGHQDLWD